MPTSPNLGISHLASNQNQPEVTVNAAIDALDRAGNDSESLTVTGDTTVTAAQFNDNTLLVLGGAPAGGFNLTVPQNKRVFVIQNDSGQTATVKTAVSSLTVDIAGGQRRLLYCDGTDILALAPDYNVSGGGGGGGGGGSGVFKGALVNLTSDVLNIENAGAGTILGWDQAIYDVGGFWNAGQPTRLTIPAGVSKVIVLWGIRMTSVTSNETLFVNPRKNGAEVPGLGADNYFSGTAGFSNRDTNGTTAAIEVVEGDYLELFVNYSSTANDDIEAHNRTYLGIYAVELDTHRGALVKLLADQQIAETTPTALLWDAAVYDADGLFTLTSPTKLVVPVGAVKARLDAGVRWENNAAGYRRIGFLKNGSPHFDGNAVDARAAAGGIETEATIQTPALAVAGGDEFEVVVEHSSTQSGGINVEAQSDAGSPAAAATWFAIEIID